MERHRILTFLRRIQEEHGGAIPTERFMREALYHPEFGYYTANIRDIGHRGDFSTSVTLGNELGRAIARWIESRIGELGWNGWKNVFNKVPLIEIGAGNGSLARTVLRNLDPRLRWRIDYMIHETSPTLRRIQKKRLRWAGVQWISSLPKTLVETAGKALIFSNELVDAFPCRVFERGESGWHEIGLRIAEDSSLAEVLLPQVEESPDFRQFSHLSKGQRVELHESYRSWLNAWGHLWKNGAMLTIDYGETADRLYERRPAGTFRGYWQHERITGSQVYARFGKQDLTADVNFSDLIKWGLELGWLHHPLSTQSEFLDQWLSPTGQSPVTTARIDDLREAHDTFKILEQRTRCC